MKDKKGTVNNSTAAVAKPKKKKKVLIVVLVIIALLAVIIGTAVHNATKEVAMVSNTVEIEPVQKRDLSDTISLKGTVAGVSSTNVTSKAASEITSMNVQVGDIVQAGDVLCTLDSTSIEEKIADLEKTISNSNAVDGINNQQAADAVQQAKDDQATQLADAQLAIQRAQDEVNRIAAAPVDPENPNSKDDAARAANQALEDAQTNYAKVLESTNRAIQSAEQNAELNQYKDSDSTAKDTLTDLKEQLADCEIVAPSGGVVTAVNSKVGDVNTEKNVILTIEDTSSLKMVATVQEADVLKLEEGMKATVTADATGEEEISGTVTRVVRVKSQSTGTGDGTAAGGYSVEISIDSSDLLIGMATKARVMIQEKGECLAVPYDLIQYDENGNAFVMVAEKAADGSATAHRRNIEVGAEVDYYTEVTGGDLKEGDMLIYDYSFSIADGQTFAPEQLYSEQDMGLDAGDGTDPVSGAEVVE
ncbi:MAG: efflux RND transporter periplasmic adaptor subunit [Roseburia sp.]|nr:efflux RND transporter periplasmic adaptor subunit [Roseburia sp.]